MEVTKIEIFKLFGSILIDNGEAMKSLSNTEKKFADVGDKLEKFGKGMMVKVTTPILAAATAAAKFSTDLNGSMALIGTLIPGQSERVLELKDRIREVAIETGKFTDDIASGTYDVISAYGDASDTMDKVAINAKAATAGVATTSDALNLSSSIMKGYGDTTAEANAKVMDLAFLTLKLGQTSFPDLAASMGKVVPMSNELGISQEELFAIYATGTGVTGNASEVSTQYQAVLKSLMTPTKSMTELMKAMGVEDGKAMIAKYGLGESIKKIVDHSKETKQPLSEYIGSINGQVIALALAGEQADVFAEKLGELQNSTGAMEVAFNEVTNGINETGFSWQQSMVKMQVVAQKFGDSMAPILDKGAELLSKLTDRLNELTPAQQENIIKIAALAAAIGPLIFICGKLVAGIGAVLGVIGTVSGAIAVVTTGATAATPAIAGLAAVFTFMTGPVGIAVAAIAGLIAAGIALYKNWDTIKEKAGQLGNWVSEKWEGLKIATSEAWDNLKETTKRAWENMQNKVEEHGGGIKGIIGAYTETYKEVWGLAFNKLNEITGGKLGEVVEKVIGFGKNTVEKITNIGKNIVEGLWNGISGMAEWVKEKVTGFAEGVAGAFKNFFGIKSPSKLMAEYGENIDEGLAKGIEANQHKPVNAITAVGEKMASTAKDIASSILDMLTIDMNKGTYSVGNVGYNTKSENTRFQERKQQDFNEYGDEIKNIAEKQGVDLGVAYDMWQQNELDKLMNKAPKYHDGGTVDRLLQGFNMKKNEGLAKLEFGEKVISNNNANGNSGITIILQEPKLFREEDADYWGELIVSRLKSLGVVTS